MNPLMAFYDKGLRLRAQGLGAPGGLRLLASPGSARVGLGFRVCFLGGSPYDADLQSRSQRWGSGFQGSFVCLGFAMRSAVLGNFRLLSWFS